MMAPLSTTTTNVASVVVDGPVPELDLSDNTDSATVPVGELSYTGSDLLRFAVVGLLMLATGVSLVAVARGDVSRNNSSHSSDV